MNRFKLTLLLGAMLSFAANSLSMDEFDVAYIRYGSEHEAGKEARNPNMADSVGVYDHDQIPGQTEEEIQEYIEGQEKGKKQARLKNEDQETEANGGQKAAGGWNLMNFFYSRKQNNSDHESGSASEKDENNQAVPNDDREKEVGANHQRHNSDERDARRRVRFGPDAIHVDENQPLLQQDDIQARLEEQNERLNNAPKHERFHKLTEKIKQLQPQDAGEVVPVMEDEVLEDGAGLTDDVQEDEIPGQDNPRLENGSRNFFTSSFNYFTKFVSSPFRRNSANLDEAEPVEQSSFARYKKPAIAGGVAFGALLATVVAKSLLSKENDESQDSDVEECFSEENPDISEIEELVQKAVDAFDAAESNDEDHNEDQEKNESSENAEQVYHTDENSEVDYTELCQEDGYYRTTLTELVRILNLPKMQSKKLELEFLKKLIENKIDEFIEVVKEYNASDDALKLAEAIIRQYQYCEKLLVSSN